MAQTLPTTPAQAILTKAVRAEEEAVNLFRALSAARPAVFAAELARSLWVLGDLYADVDRMGESLETLHEAASVVAPCFQASPAALAGMTNEIVKNYLTKCQSAGMQPDTALTTPILRRLTELNHRTKAP